MTQIEMPFGRDKLCVRIPDDVLGEVVSPKPARVADDPEAEVRAALDEPIGAPRLEQIAKPGHKVAVIVDDKTRETPTRLMLPRVLERLAAAGVLRQDIRIVIALGTHPPMNEDEIAAKVGADVAREFEIVNVSCEDQSRMVYLDTASNGIPAWVNRAVAEADVRVGIGGIVPHPDAGYGGGGKIILPGVCSVRTIEVFHATGAADRENWLGVVGAPIRRALELFVQETVGLDFILNAVLTSEGGLHRCVAGHFIQAHRAGVEIARQVYGAAAKRRYPLVISNAFPVQRDLWQSNKALWTGEALVSAGGTLILLTSCEEGNSVHPLFADYVGRDADELQAELDSGQVEDANACVSALHVARMKRYIRFGLVSPGLDRDVAERMGFAYYDSVEQAIAAELDDAVGGELVGVLTHGGFTIPSVQ